MSGRRVPAMVRSGRRHGTVLGAAGLAVLLAATVLAALVALTENAVEGGVRQRLAADREAAVEVAGRYDADRVRRWDGHVRAAVDRTYGDVPHRTRLALRAPAARNDELAVTEAGGHRREDATVSVVALEGARSHAGLVAGRWPRGGGGGLGGGGGGGESAGEGTGGLGGRGGSGGGGAVGVHGGAVGGGGGAGGRVVGGGGGAAGADGGAAGADGGAGGRVVGVSGGPVEVVLTRAFAAELAVRTGDEVVVRGAGGRPVRMEVVGLYTTEGRGPAVWAGLSSTFGTADSIALTTRDAFTARPGLANDAGALWLGVPRAQELRLGDIGPLTERAKKFGGSDSSLSVLRGKGTKTKTEAEAEADLTVSAGLRRALDRLTTPIAVARAGLYVPATLLAALAVAALVLTGRQLAEHRRPELALLAARGAGTRRLVLSTGVQWAVIALPAGIAAPFLAGPLLRLLEGAGLLHGRAPDVAVVGAAWVASAFAVVVHGCAVLLPTARVVRDRRAVSRLRLRAGRFAGTQRVGADVALGAVAVLGWLQLRQYRSPVTGDGVDPVLVFAPVVMTTAAALLVLRLLPLLTRAIDPLARRGRGIVLPLGGWQIGRRAARHAGPALVVTLALAVAALSSTALAILDRGDHDQAAFAVGADLRIEPGESVPSGERRATYGALPGIDAVTPVVHTEGYIGQDAVTVTGINTARGPVPSLRDDLAERPVRELVAPLGKGVAKHGLAVAGAGSGSKGAAGELPLRVRLSADGPGRAVVPVRLTVYFEDEDGLVHPSAALLKEGGPRTVPLKVPVRGGGLRILQIDLSMTGETVRRTYRLRVDRVPGLTDEAEWRDLREDASDRYGAGCPGAERPRGTVGESPGPVLCKDRPAPGVLLDAVLRGPDTRLKYPTWSVRLGTDSADSADSAERRPAAPALADRALLEAGAVRVGDVVTVRRSTGGSARLKIIGRIAAVPGVARDRPRLLADSRAMAAQLVLSGALPGAESVWWAGAGAGADVEVGDGRGDASAAWRAVRDRPRLGTAVDVPHARVQLGEDPLRRGARAGLWLCLALAPAFAVIAFTLHTVLSARARGREFALLRALGVRRGQLAAYLWTEQLALAGAAAFLGTLLGAGLAAVIMPVITVDAAGNPVFPGLLTEVPWMRVCLVGAGVTVAICGVVSGAAHVLGRVDLGRVLRAGEEG
ncbi:FtsX-like permease family protein [Streptomyces longisporoflavus]|uniref:FtsX-like permease family protein n=1 Tax=Streptomyces longisporoflavus TaxID=28044 RepID=UPI00227D7B17|nr:FtsX-like permease family protein [Streptomyces longisporoflavus]